MGKAMNHFVNDSSRSKSKADSYGMFYDVVSESVASRTGL